MKKKVAIITCLLVPEACERTDKELEAIIRLYLEPEDIALCKKIEKVKVSSAKNYE